MLASMATFTVTASSGGVRENETAYLPYGALDISGELNPDNYCSMEFSDDTVGYFWEQKPFTANATLYFRASDDGLYFAADINESISSGNNFVPATGLDDINNRGQRREYGYNGDVMTLMIDPVGLFERSEKQRTAWYNVALFEDGTVHMYRSQVNEADITDEIIAYGGEKLDEEGWYFQTFIPWSIIIADAKAMLPDADLTVSDITNNVITRASCIYMDRYLYEGNRHTWGRFITVCEKTYDGYFGTSTSGTVAKAYGLKLNIDRNNSHNFGAWSVVSSPSCTQEGYEERKCADCDKSETRIIKALGHDWSDWSVEKEPTESENGLKSRSCNRCKARDEKILSYTETEPIVVVYYNATQSTTSYEFENIDVLNFHPAQVLEAAGYPDNPINLNSMAQLPFVRSKAREQNPDIKITMAIANGNLSVFESWLNTDTHRKQFSKYLVDAVKKYELDGIDIDYEFPSSTDLRDEYVLFIKQVRADLDELSYEEGRELTLTLAVPAGQWAFSLFDIVSLAESVDWFNIMSYDLYCGSNFKLTHHHTPAYDNSAYPGGSVASDIALYLSKGIAKNKICVGAGMYARRWTNVQSDSDGLFSQGLCDESNIHYSELRSSFVNKNGFVRYWDDNSKAPYLYNADAKIFISYDDEESVAAKCDLILENGIRGLMVFDYCTCDGCGFFDQLATFLDSSTGNHIWGTWETVSEPDCESKGMKIRKCSCGEIEYQDVDALGHSYETEWVKIPTSTEDGAYRLFCTRCGKEEPSVSTGLIASSYWDTASNGMEFEIVDGDIAVKTNSNEKINPFAKVISKYPSTLDGFNVNVTPSSDTDSLAFFLTNAHDWYDGEDEWSVGDMGHGAGNYRFGILRNSHPAKENTYCVVLCDKLDMGWFVYPGTADDGIFDTVVNHTVSNGNFWGSSAHECKFAIGEDIDFRMFNCYSEDDCDWSLGFIINDEWFFDSNCVSAFQREESFDGYYFGMIAYTEGAGTANAAFRINSIGDDETSADFMGLPYSEHEHSFGNWYTVIEASCKYRGVDKRKCTCGISEKTYSEKTEHSFGEWTVVSEPTEASSGLKIRKCSVCNTVESEALEPISTKPVVSTKRHLLSVTKADTISYIRIAYGEFTEAADIKNAVGTVSVNERYVSDSSVNNVYLRRIADEGKYTIYIRCKDGSEYIEGFEIENPAEPLSRVTSNGYKVNVVGLDGAKAVRIAYGEYANVREIKNAEKGYRGISARYFENNTLDFKISSSLPEGIYTVIVEYEDGYTEIHSLNIEKKMPTYSLDGNVLTVGNIDELSLIRYAKGVYNTTKEIKNAKNSSFLRAGSTGVTELQILLENGENSIAFVYKDNPDIVIVIMVE